MGTTATINTGNPNDESRAAPAISDRVKVRGSTDKMDR